MVQAATVEGEVVVVLAKRGKAEGGRETWPAVASDDYRAQTPEINSVSRLDEEKESAEGDTKCQYKKRRAKGIKGVSDMRR